MQELKFIIAKNIQSLRQEAGMTQAELAAKLSYSDKSVSKWERGESLPDIVVLKGIADYFQVSLDYLVEREHAEVSPAESLENRVELEEKKKRNYYIITGASMFLVVIFAALLFIIFSRVWPNTLYPWLCYAYALPAAVIVWLVFNSVWFDPHKNFGIVSALVWSLLFALYLTFLFQGYTIWPVFLVGIPVQVIIWMWSNLKKNGSVTQA